MYMFCIVTVVREKKKFAKHCPKCVLIIFNLICVANMWYEMYIRFFQVSSVILKIKDSSKALVNL